MSLLRFQSQNNRPRKLASQRSMCLILMISIGLFAMTSTITKPEKKWTVDSEWYEAKNYPCRVSFSIFWHLPILIKKTGMSNFGRGDLSSKTKHFFFSTFMHLEKHADYMQINCFLLVKEKKRSYQRKKGNFNITFVYTCVFQNADALLCRVLNTSNLKWHEYVSTHMPSKLKTQTL